MKKTPKLEYQKRLDKITKIFSSIATHADEQSTYRCPYKNRFDKCTAKFGCRNQKKPRTKDGLLTCGSDDKLDYRNAWEMETTDRDAGNDEGIKYGTGSIMHNDERRKLVVGKNIFDYADELTVQVPTSCGRTGYCHECIVEIEEGMKALQPRTEAESFLNQNYRLACQAVIKDADAHIQFAPLRREPKLLTNTQVKSIEVDPIVSRYKENVYYEREIIDKFRGHLYGVAIDLGTTTIVMDLVNLETGISDCVSSFENPQRFGGSDVMNRISYDAKFSGELRKALVNALNHEITAMCKRLNFRRQEIYEIVIAGNSTMRDIFFELDVQGIGQKPYKSTTEHKYLAGECDSTSLIASARKLGLKINQKAKIYGMPLIASHVGGDVAADLAAIDVESQEGIIMLVDVGTNTEGVVGNSGRLVSASCPAGPAFEGGGIKYGMPGYEGAIESIKWDKGDIEYKTIGDKEPQGICGSGLIDLLAELRRNDQMTPMGVFADKRQYELPIVPEFGITFSREDASNLAQAKAANYCGQFIVMREQQIVPATVNKLFLAGGFANYVNVGNAIEIGFIAPVSEKNIIKVGNAAIQGAREVILSKRKRKGIEQLVKNIEHIELETQPDFFDIFVEACQFKPMPKKLL